jgi:molecular chaperone GrpE (heat shock protein)
MFFCTESIVVQLLEQQGLELILAMGELVDIDIQHAVERVINQLKTPGTFGSRICA